MTSERRYKAFISYSHRDKAWASRIHARLELFRTPKKLVGAAGLHGDIPRKLTPVFRDREELPSGSALGPALQDALQRSEFLLVLCSPASANSKYVNEEIRFFRRTHGDERVLAAIVDGEPGDPVGPGERGCFPPALLEPPEGSDVPREPIAADFREHADGPRLAFQKLAAGMLGVGLDALVQRMAQRRQKRAFQLAGVMAALVVVLSGLTIHAFRQEAIADEQRAIAEKERDTATASLDFLVSIFEIANPETENPKTITALTILERGREKIDEELDGQPAVQAKLLGAMGQVYVNLGQFAEANEAVAGALDSGAAEIQDELIGRIILARLAIDGGERDGVVENLDRVRSLLEANVSTEKLSRDEWLYHRGQLAAAQARFARAEADDLRAIALYREALDFLVKTPKSRLQDQARLHGQLGSLLASRADKINEARQELSKAVAIYENVSGELHIDTARAIHNLAFVEFNGGDYKAAKELMARAYERYQLILNENHPTLSRATLLLGRISRAQGDFSDAVDHFQNSKDMSIASRGPNNKHVAGRLMYLALAQADAGDLSAASASLDEAAAIYALSAPDDQFNRGDISVYRAYVAAKAGRREEARDLCRDGLETLGAVLAADNKYLLDWTAQCAGFAA